MQVKIRPSDHFEERRKLREIPKDLAEEILVEADAHYRDEETGYYIAAKHLIFQDKERDVALVYAREKDEIIFITLHPLKEGQKENRIKSRRWIPYEPESKL